jgi:hypothetical protein
LYIGGYPNSDPYLWDGYIDELRISKGIARWTSNFTPPDAPYSAASAAVTPTFTNFASDSETTNFSDSNAVPDITNVSHPILATTHAKVEWSGSGYDLDGVDLDSHIQLSHNFVHVDSAALPTLNRTANITMNGVSYPDISAYDVYSDGVVCESPECVKISADPVKFQVQHFSNYTTGGTGAVPEFSIFTLGLGMIAVLVGLVMMRRRQ